MFQDLDATLRALLSDPAAPADLRAADVSFDTPDRGYQPAQATLNFFLHEVVENRELRDEARVMTRTETGYTSRLPSLRLDCGYLVTAWSSRTAGSRAQEEHHLLGLALLWLSRFPVIDDRYLQGALKTPAQPYPVPTVVARTRESPGMGEFWSALGISPRPGFPLTVTISVDPFDQVEPYPEVRAIEVHGTRLDDPVLAGRVVDEELEPVPGATVTLVDRGGSPVGTRTTGERGQFAFPDVEFATYTLRVQAGGRPDHETSVSYAPDRQIHNVILPGP